MESEPQVQHAASAVELAQALRSFTGKLKRRLREQAGASDLKPSQSAVLLHLEEGGASTVSALARAEGMKPQSMGAIIASLEAAGLVAGAPDPQDGRQTLLSLTQTCRQWMAEGRAARQDWLSRTLDARLSAEEQARVLQVMPLLRRLLD